MNYPPRFPLGADFNCDRCLGKGWHVELDEHVNDTGRERFCECDAGKVRSFAEHGGMTWDAARRAVLS